MKKTIIGVAIVLIIIMTALKAKAGNSSSNNNSIDNSLTNPKTSALLSGVLERDTTLTSANNPWQVDDELIVPENITLTISAGVVMYFASGANITVLESGKLLANGTADNRILMTHPPENETKWGGIRFMQTLEDNYLGYVDMLYGDAGSYMILVEDAKLTVENMTWYTLNKTVLEVDHPRLLVKDCIFPSVHSVEVIHGQSLAGEEYLVLDSNTFGTTTDYNDVIDFSDCKRPGPILQAYNNIFLGGGDDGLDLDGCDAHVEGNLFTNFHRAATNPGTSNAVSTGERFNRTSDITLVRNIFFNNDHSVLLKEDCSLQAENNVFVNDTEATVNFGEWPLRTVAPGKGANFIGNIFWNNAAPFENQFAQSGYTDPVIEVYQCIIDSAFHYLGSGNIDADPLFVNAENDFHLQAGSPALASGPNGLDMGRYVPAGASISGEPNSVTDATTADLTIAGPGITHYSYNVNDTTSNWSEELSIQDDPVLHLTGLQQGESYTVYVKGKNSAGVWQQSPNFATSQTWVVDTLYTGLRHDIPVQQPTQCRLYQNSPNPFNPVTAITFDIPQNGHVTLEIYNMQGQKVAELVNNQLAAGTQCLEWNAQTCASGLYYAVLRYGNITQSLKLILLK